MKDIRDRYTAEEFGEDNMVASDRSMRSSQNLEDDTIEQTVFDYIYGDKSIDLDALLWEEPLSNCFRPENRGDRIWETNCKRSGN